MSPLAADRGPISPTRAEVRARIYETFVARAAQDGPRGVVMAELARELGISTRTLYQHFPSKAELVAEIMRRWAAEVAEKTEACLKSGLGPIERMQRSAEAWVESQNRFSRTFWLQIQRDYPAALGVLVGQVKQSLRVGREQLGGELREELHQKIAFQTLIAALQTAADPATCDRLGVSREQAVREAIEIWSRGALPQAGDAAPARAEERRDA